MVNPNDFIITRKRKLYKFALFSNSPLCFEYDSWQAESRIDVLEVGAGTGLFSAALASGQPDLEYVAIDVKADRLQKGALFAAANALNNIRFLRIRVDQLNEKIQQHSIKKIWVTFPDPFPRERSAKRRLTHPQFLAVYKNLLGSSGELYFKTDARMLFLWSLEQMVAEGWTFKELSFDLHASNLHEGYKVKTTYETRYLAEGKPIYFVKAVPPAL